MPCKSCPILLIRLIVDKADIEKNFYEHYNIVNTLYVKQVSKVQNIWLKEAYIKSYATSFDELYNNDQTLNFVYISPMNILLKQPKLYTITLVTCTGTLIKIKKKYNIFTKQNKNVCIMTIVLNSGVLVYIPSKIFKNTLIPTCCVIKIII